MTSSQATGYTPFFMVYGSETILLTDLDYGAPRVRVYNEQGAEASLEDAMDQLDEACDIALLRSAKYPQALRRYHSCRVQGWAFNVGDLVLCLVQSNKNHHKLSLCRGRDRTSSRRCSDQPPISSGPSTVKSSSTPRTSNSYAAFTLNLCTLSLIGFAIDSSIFSNT